MLLTNIKKLAYKYRKDTQNPNVTYHALLESVQNLLQGDLSLAEYYKKLYATINVIEEYNYR